MSPNLSPTPIDRRRLVSRHKVVLYRADALSPLSVGNGEFAFTADVTGLQSFPAFHLAGIPLCTMAQWGWHSFPAPAGLAPFRHESFDAHGRPVPYAISKAGQADTFDFLRQSPHRLHLGRIGFDLGEDPAALTDTRQELDLWSGTLSSQFRAGGLLTQVQTLAHPSRDLVAAHITGPRPVVFRFPYGSPLVPAADWSQPDRHHTALVSADTDVVTLERRLDNDRHFVRIAWSDGALAQTGPHEWTLTPAEGAAEFSFTCEFFTATRSLTRAPASFDDTRAAAQSHWSAFWSTGGAIDLSQSRDPRWRELERRCVLSQYLTAINCSGTLPPAETGLTCNSWYGKFHLEMHWWHAAQFPLWGRPQLLLRSLAFYDRILPAARTLARSQGYLGARWPKMTDPTGLDSPSPIGPLLIWQQPHPIYYAELLYHATGQSRVTLDAYREIVHESAEFMASYAVLVGDQYHLGPPVIPAQENHPPRTTLDPTFELAYWHFGLRIAQLWRERLGLPHNPHWDDILARLAPLPIQDGVYLAHAAAPDTYTTLNHDHPSMLGALGVLPGDGVDPATMLRTLEKVRDCWSWPDTWGWDYPMAAMTAARLGRPDLALDLLLLDTPKNRYLPNGHNFQRPDLHLYLPGNGGLLAALACMTAGWQGYEGPPNPGFPADGSWTVQAEGLRPLL